MRSDEAVAVLNLEKGSEARLRAKQCGGLCAGSRAELRKLASLMQRTS